MHSQGLTSIGNLTEEKSRKDHRTFKRSPVSVKITLFQMGLGQDGVVSSAFGFVLDAFLPGTSQNTMSVQFLKHLFHIISEPSNF